MSNQLPSATDRSVKQKKVFVLDTKVSVDNMNLFVLRRI